LEASGRGLVACFFDARLFSLVDRLSAFRLCLRRDWAEPMSL
jgi:hypothetical protein